MVLFYDEYPTFESEYAAQPCREADVFVVVGTSLSVGVASELVFLPRKDVPRYLIDPDDFSGRIPDGYIHLREKAVEGMRLFRKEVERGFPSFTRSMDGNAD